MVNCVVPFDKLEEETVQWCHEILALSPMALRMLKASFNADTDGLAGLQQFAGDATLMYYTTDEAKEGFDLKASIKLKQWKPYGTKVFTITDNATIQSESQRTPSADAPTTGGTYTVKKGDSLWKIAKQFYGNGADYTKIAGSNTDTVKNPNLIYPGQVLMIP